MDTHDSSPFPLSVKQRKFLRGLAHHLEPTVYVGKEGLSSALLQAAESALKAHELIKIKLGQNCPHAKHDAADALARSTSSALVQLIGKMVILYRPNPDLAADKRIELN